MSKRCDNAIGKRVGIYDVLYKCDYRDKDGHELCRVKCSVCGWESNMRLSQISKAKTCTHVCLGGNFIPQYSWKSQRLRRIFSNIKSRCYDPSNKSYRWYGGKGIIVCDEWLLNPASFEEWALQNGYNDDLTIDRIDESLGYRPDNCRWITVKANSKYKSTTRVIYVNGAGHTGRDWAKILSIGTNVINKMIREYDEDIVIRFIRARMENPSLKARNKSWLKVYGLI